MTYSEFITAMETVYDYESLDKEPMTIPNIEELMEMIAVRYEWGMAIKSLEEAKDLYDEFVYYCTEQSFEQIVEECNSNLSMIYDKFYDALFTHLRTCSLDEFRFCLERTHIDELMCDDMKGLPILGVD